MKTKVFKDKYKGQVMFAIYEVDDNGKKLGEKPVVSFGVKKAQAVKSHIVDLEKYVELYGDEVEESDI